jgi:protocatechuate 3,4-dioxygenase alpha subunit
VNRLAPTPPQTVGPFFHGGLLREGMNIMASGRTPGERIRIEGQVLDGDGAPVNDAVVELWQADASGKYRHPADAGAWRGDAGAASPLEPPSASTTPRLRPPAVQLQDEPAGARPSAGPDAGASRGDVAFTGFGRCGTDDDGRYWFETIMPGRVPGPDRDQAQHINVAVFARGLLHHLSTRLYFEDGTGNEADVVLQRIPAERRGTMIAHRTGSGTPPTYRFDIVLQGPNETVFFNL